VRAVLRGERVYDSLVGGKMKGMAGTAAPPGEALTACEMDVLRLLARGLRNREIGKRLSVSHRTVDFHVRNIMGKLRARNRLEAVRIAREKGIIE
jgi:DNA-binding NarL/FixJ family response regulator